MGCDIHCHTEIYRDGAWRSTVKAKEAFIIQSSITIPTEKYLPETPDYGRDYMLFGLLSRGVRTSWIMPNGDYLSVVPKGLPTDMSPEVAAEWQSWNDDSHSHSWLTLQELFDLRINIEDAMINIWGNQLRSELADLRKGLEHFIDMVQPLEQLIEWCADGQPFDPNLVRVVFWFDN